VILARMAAEESTTPDLVQVVTGLFEAADRGDWEAVVRPYAADVVWESEDGMMSSDGAHAVRSLWEECAGTFEDFGIEVESVVDLGGGVVHAVYRQHGRMAGSSALLTARGVLAYEWRDGTILRVFAWADTDEARAAAERLAEERG
jgi:ketosteroid isomerase-like protein